MKGCILSVLIALLASVMAHAQNAQVEHNVVARDSFIEKGWFSAIKLELAFDAPVGSRIRYLNQPFRIIFEFDDVNLDALPNDFGDNISAIENLQFGAVPGGARMVMTFDEPHFVSEFVLTKDGLDGKAGLRAQIIEVSESEFADKTQGLDYERANDLGFEIPLLPEGGEELPLIMIDPGHGGVDFGAQKAGVREKDVTLLASLILANAFLETDRYRIVLTRDEDQYLTLLARRQLAERLQADLFLSIHADSVEVGDARGTTIYTLSDEATSEVAAKFALFENRVDLFAGEHLEGEKGDLSVTLTKLAQNASLRDARAIADELQELWVKINAEERESRQESAAFAVLKSPDVPSLLLEIGFITNHEDREKIQSEEFLREMSELVVFAADRYFYPLVEE